MCSHWPNPVDPAMDLDKIKKIIKNEKVKPSSKRPWRPVGLWDVKDPTLSRQSAHRWRQGCQLYPPAELYFLETFRKIWLLVKYEYSLKRKKWTNVEEKEYKG
jgi:hypothetical protein